MNGKKPIYFADRNYIFTALDAELENSQIHLSAFSFSS
jgi:hypothetical protein